VGRHHRRDEMTEDQIERKVQRMMDRLDFLLLTGQLDQDRYDDAVCDLDKWAEEQYR
jgi:hypothetical protein